MIIYTLYICVCVSWQFLALRFGCPHSKDPKSRRAGTGGPPDGTFKNLKTGATDSGGIRLDPEWGFFWIL